METLQTILGSVFLLAGCVVFGMEIFGIFKLKYVLNRMHMAAMGDTLGLELSIIGLMIMSGWNIVTLKIFLVLFFLTITSPISSHLLAKLEVVIGDTDKEFTREEI